MSEFIACYILIWNDVHLKENPFNSFPLFFPPETLTLDRKKEDEESQEGTSLLTNHNGVQPPLDIGTYKKWCKIIVLIHLTRFLKNSKGTPEILSHDSRFTFCLESNEVEKKVRSTENCHVFASLKTSFDNKLFKAYFQNLKSTILIIFVWKES